MLFFYLFFHKGFEVFQVPEQFFYYKQRLQDFFVTTHLPFKIGLIMLFFHQKDLLKFNFPYHHRSCQKIFIHPK